VSGIGTMFVEATPGDHPPGRITDNRTAITLTDDYLSMEHDRPPTPSINMKLTVMGMPGGSGKVAVVGPPLELL
jgi:hypothetical protein